MDCAFRPPRACEIIDASILRIGHVLSWLNVMLVAIIMLAIVFRYLFRIGFVWVEELEWHLYSVNVMMGIGYCVVRDTHIRTDVVSFRWSPNTKAIVEILGIIFLVLPLVIVLLVHAYSFWYESWRLREASVAPMGLCCRWLIKAFIPTGLLLWGLASVSRLARCVVVLLNTPNEKDGEPK